jgi:hypothetical protein
MGERTIQARTPIAGTVAEIIPGLGAVIVSRGFCVRGAGAMEKQAWFSIEA